MLLQVQFVLLPEALNCVPVTSRYHHLPFPPSRYLPSHLDTTTSSSSSSPSRYNHCPSFLLDTPTFPPLRLYHLPLHLINILTPPTPWDSNPRTMRFETVFDPLASLQSWRDSVDVYTGKKKILALTYTLYVGFLLYFILEKKTGSERVLIVYIYKFWKKCEYISLLLPTVV